jgi:hypothetical protein
MSIPGFTAVASLHKTSRRYQAIENRASSFNYRSGIRSSDVDMQAKSGGFGRGPRRIDLPNSFTCDATSINIETCHSCSVAWTGVRYCVCYDCDRGSGDCFSGYDCTTSYPPFQPAPMDQRFPGLVRPRASWESSQ